MRGLCFIVLPVLLSGTALLAQVDLQRAATELAHVLDRPSGTTIGAAQKAAVAEFLQRYEGEDLGALGYASAMASYLDRDMPGAVASLDAFFARHPAIANEEHRQVAGRIYLSSLAAAGRAETIDVAALHRHAERAARMYADLRTLARVTTPLLANERVADKAALRVALLRGACAGSADAATIDAFAAGLYGEVAPPAPPARRAPAPTAELVGKPAPSWTATDVVRANGDKAGLASGDLLGKVVVLDFFASWCPPCRAAIPHLVDLQAKHREDLQVVALTKAYGYGMDFSDPDAKAPSGGKTVRGLEPRRRGRAVCAVGEGVRHRLPDRLRRAGDFGQLRCARDPDPGRPRPRRQGGGGPDGSQRRGVGRSRRAGAAGSLICHPRSVA